MQTFEFLAKVCRSLNVAAESNNVMECANLACAIALTIERAMAKKRDISAAKPDAVISRLRLLWEGEVTNMRSTER